MGMILIDHSLPEHATTIMFYNTHIMEYNGLLHVNQIHFPLLSYNNTHLTVPFVYTILYLIT